MKIIVTKLGTAEGNGGKGKVLFYKGAELVHTEEFVGMINESEYTRLVDLSMEGVRAQFLSIDGEFEGRIEE